MNATLPPTAVLELAAALQKLFPQQEAEPTFAVKPDRYVTIALAAACTGYSVKAIEKKIETGVWVAGDQYVRAPDGRVLIDLEGYRAWVAGQKSPLTSGKRQSA